MHTRSARVGMPIFSSHRGSAYEKHAGDGIKLVLSGLAGVKVRTTALHASRPWVAVGDDLGFVSIHDYQSSLLIFKIQPVRCRIRLLVFVDAHDALWRGRLQVEALAGMLHGRMECATTGTVLPPVCATDDTRLIALVTDTSVLLVDYATRHAPREVSGLDARLVNALHIVPRYPAGGRQLLIAVACSDGVVRIIDTETHRTVRELSCGKKKATALNHLVVCHGRSGVSLAQCLWKWGILMTLIQ
jgi:hypothetical protein